MLRATRHLISAACTSTHRIARVTQMHRPYSKFKNTKTAQNLMAAFASESMTNRRYVYFAERADIEGHVDAATAFRTIADGESSHALGHLEWLQDATDPMTDMPMGDTMSNLESAIVGESNDSAVMYPKMAQEARDEGFEDIAQWFETLARAEEAHASKFQQVLDDM